MFLLFSLSLAYNAHLLEEVVDPDEESPACDVVVHLQLHQTIIHGSIDVITPTYQLSKAFWFLSSRHRRARLWARVRLGLNVPRAMLPTKSECVRSREERA